MRASPSVVVLSVGLALGGVGCSSTNRNSPYSPLSESNRDGQKAQRLNAEAAKLIDKDTARAEKLLREALTADLYCGPAHNNLGVICVKENRLYEAAGELEWARKLLPGLAEPRLNLGIVMERAGRTDEALATYATALEVYTDHLPTMQAMALLQVRAGKTDERTKHMLDEIALRGESERWREWAKLQRARANP